MIFFRGRRPSEDASTTGEGTGKLLDSLSPARRKAVLEAAGGTPHLVLTRGSSAVKYSATASGSEAERE